MIKNFNVKGFEAKSFDTDNYDNIAVNMGLTFSKPTMENGVINIGFVLDFVFVNPSLGYIKYIGDVDYVDDKGKTKELFASWIKEEPSDKAVVEIGNMITVSLTPISLMVGNLMDLPPVIRLPKLGGKMNIKKTKHEEPDIYG